MQRGADQPLAAEYARREVQAIARDGRVMGTAEFIERMLLIRLEPWQARICDWVDQADVSIKARP